MDRAEAIKRLTDDWFWDWDDQFVVSTAESYGFRDALDMAIAALREQSVTDCHQWISVKERLPETHQNVLVFQTDGRVLKGWLGTANKWFAPGVVSHWMPLPEPPKEGAEGC